MNRRGVCRYSSYEAREDAFRRIVGGLIPRRYGGPRLFWEDFRQVAAQGFEAAATHPAAHITANPRDCLAFGSARQVLAAALMTVGGPLPVSDRIEDLAAAFGIQNNLGQPVRTLSGGETVKVALAKAAALQVRVGRLVIASPFSWLSRDNHLYLEALLERYEQGGVPVEILLLEGEDSDRPAPATVLAPGPVFDLCLAGVRTPLSPTFGVIGNRPLLATMADFTARLASPCLVVGANGQGKSLLAKVLSRAVPFEGRAWVDAGNGPGQVRLLFQDVMTQTLLRDRRAIAAAARCPNGEDARAVVAALDHEFQRCRPAGSADGDGPEAPALSAVKIMLAAVRLCTRPAALILDEPDWGLSREDAIAFVQAIIAVAHRQGTAVLLISHKSWWQDTGGSILHVVRRSSLPVDGAPANLSIGLQAAASTERAG